MVKELQADTRRAAQLAERVTGLDRRIAALQGQIAEAEEAAAQRPGRQAELERQVARCLEAAAQLPGLVVERDRWSDRVRAAVAARTVASRLATADSRVLELRESLVTARELVADLRTARLDGMAAELAAGLRPGEGLPRLRVHRASPPGRRRRAGRDRRPGGRRPRAGRAGRRRADVGPG